MISLNDITSFDVIVALLFLLPVIRGAWIGLVRQLAVFLALVGSYLLAGKYTGDMMLLVEQYIDNPKTVFFISFGLLFVLGAVFFLLMGKALRLVMEFSLVGWFDRVLGFFLGVVKGAFVASFLFMVVSSSTVATHDLLARSQTTPYLEQGAEFVRQLINDPEIREFFLPKKPAILPELEPALEQVEEMYEKIVPGADRQEKDSD